MNRHQPRKEQQHERVPHARGDEPSDISHFVIGETMKGKVIDTVNAIRTMMDSGKLPPPANDARCKECSLKEICQPDALAERYRLKSLREELFNAAE
jgi:hypothetical protein